jgi:predicted restriction endonuclease
MENDMDCETCEAKEVFIAWKHGCCNKQRFNSEASANNVLKDYAKRKFVLNGNAYKCRFCGAWHIGHYSEKRVSIEIVSPNMG